MKKYLLDTNICIFYMKGRYQLDEKIKKVGQKNCYISEITVAELLYGVSRSGNKEKHLKQTAEFISQFKVMKKRQGMKKQHDGRRHMSQGDVKK